MATKKAVATPVKKTAAETITKTAAETITKTAVETTGKPKPAAKKAVPQKAPAEGTSAAKLPGTKQPTHSEIAVLAHSYWQERGEHHGSHHDDWIRAEKELKS